MRTSSTPTTTVAPTRPSRLLWADLVRASALLVVVFGHYLMAVIHIDNGDVAVSTLLDRTTWSHPLTWLLQVMGCFFAVGAVVAAPRLARRLAAVKADGTPGGRAAIWRDHVVGRTRSLLVPSLPLLAVWWLVGPALNDRFAPEVVTRASQAALVPLWFLAVYLLVHALLPLTVEGVARYGVWRPVAFLLAMAGVVDVAHLSGVPFVGWVNFGLVWMAPTTIGVGVGLGLVRPRDLARAAAFAFVAALGALAFAGYSIPLVGTATAGRPNNHPPTLLLGLHAVAHSSVILALAPRLEGWLRASARRRRALAAAGTWSMPIYLWHMTGLVVVAASVVTWDVPVIGQTFALEPLSGEWWLARPLQMAAATAMTAVLIAFVTRPTMALVTRSSRAGGPGTAGALAGVIGSAYAIAAVVWRGTATVNLVTTAALVVAVIALHPAADRHGVSERLSK